MPPTLSRRIALTATLALAWLAACQSKAHFKSIDITGANYAQNFELPDTEGRVRKLAEFKGKLVVVFFGYTQCPDVCPTTLQEFTQARQQLGAKADQVQVIFITLDPERDTPEVLREYMKSFDPGYIALIPSAEQLAQAARDFKVLYRKVPGPTGTSYTMEHTAASFVYDAQGHIRLYTRYGMGPKALAEDLQQLL
jgi:protein SCO1/2